MDLKEKVVFLTGASDGIGHATALALAKEGAYLALTYHTQQKKAEALAKECEKLTKVLLLPLDIRDSGQILSCVEGVIDEYGGIDILINNAGVVVWKELVEQTPEDISSQVETNLLGPILLTRATLPYFQAQGAGLVLTISSTAGKTGYGEIAPYCATKFGLRGFTQAMAEEYAKFQIKFFSINPGMTATKMTDFQGVDPEDVAHIIVEAAQENYGKTSGEDIDVGDYL